MVFRVSIVIRSHNDRKYISPLLEMLSLQTIQNCEIINCDDHSTDGTAQLLAANLCVKQISPPEGRYIPGKTLNHCVRHCSGEIIVFNNSDVIPLHREYLENLLAPFVTGDKSIAASFANQHPRPDAWNLVCKDHARAFGDGKISANWRNFFSLASSAIRRDWLNQVPFDENIQYNEEVEWLMRCRAAGGRAVYVPDAEVEHSHNYTNTELWKRFYNEGRADGRIYGVPDSFASCLRQIGMETLRDWMWLVQHRTAREFLQAPIRRTIQKYGHYRGMRDCLAEMHGDVEK